VPPNFITMRATPDAPFRKILTHTAPRRAARALLGRVYEQCNLNSDDPAR